MGRRRKLYQNPWEVPGNVPKRASGDLLSDWPDDDFVGSGEAGGGQKASGNALGSINREPIAPWKRTPDSSVKTGLTPCAAYREEVPGAYQVKWIDFKGTTCAIVTQNENGPCPLVAIANVLLLKGQIELQKFVTLVSEGDLLQLLVDCIEKKKPTDLSESDQLKREEKVSDVLSLVPSLPQGLDINMYFSGIKEFEPTTASLLFELLDIALVHGWIPDPRQTELVSLLAGLGYNQVVERVITSEGNDGATAVLAEFLQSSATQLTVAGLAELYAHLNDDDICVLFWNNHYHTLHKHKGTLFLLLTDEGYVDDRAPVWQTLTEVDGNCAFVDASFKSSESGNSSVDSPVNSHSSVDLDDFVEYFDAFPFDDE